MKWTHLMTLGVIFSHFQLASRQSNGTKNKDWYFFEFQSTVIHQGKAKSRSPYSGENSLSGNAESANSLTSTFFADFYLHKNITIKFNPEMAGGSGLSQARGLGGFSNGETFRIGDPAPAIYVARALVEYTIPLGTEKVKAPDHILNDSVPLHGFQIAAGKFSLGDYFDGNTYSHDPRDQFMNWGLMSSGAYDYAANTRGYTQGICFSFFSPKWDLAFAAVQVPTFANGPKLDQNIEQSFSLNLSIERKWKSNWGDGTVRLLPFFNRAPMASYRNSMAAAINSAPDVSLNRNFHRTKWGIAISAEQGLGENQGLFARLSWNDGKNETWAFTEIDQSVCLGFQGSGFSNQKNEDPDIWGIALLVNGLSNPHSEYLKKGGLGFMLGDGFLNYAPEWIGEWYYRFQVPKTRFFLSPDVQFVFNPGYNKDRGPVFLYALRFHTLF